MSLTRVLHLASGDGWAGLERVMSILIDAQRTEPDLECEALLFNEGQLADTLRGMGVAVRVVPEEGRSFFSLLRAIRPYVRTADVVHTHRYKEIIAASLLLGPFGRRLVVTIHGLEPASQLTWLGCIRAWSAIVVARLARAQFACVSAELGHRLSRVVGRRSVRVITNPAPEPVEDAAAFDLRSRLGWSPERPVVAFVGRLERVKGPDLLLRIAAETESDIGFAVVGGGSMESELRELARAEQLEDRVGFVGSVPDAMPILAQCDVLALPSRHEGLPMVLLEVAVLGVPAVAFDVGGVRQVLDGGPAARVVEPDDIRAFARELERIVSAGDGLEEEIAAWAEPVRERFGVRSVVASYGELYRVARPRKRPR